MSGVVSSFKSAVSSGIDTVRDVGRDLRRGVGLPVQKDIKEQQRKAQEREEQRIAQERERAEAVVQQEEQEEQEAERRRRRQLRTAIEPTPSLFNVLGTSQRNNSTLG